MSLKIYDNQRLHFTSDHHFGHKRIIEYANRKFENITEMNQTLIDNWNTAIKPNDLMMHLGDFCFGTFDDYKRFRDQLNGKIYLIKGNHDKLTNEQLLKLFNVVDNYLEIKVEDEGWQDIILCHYAMRTWNKSHYKSFMLYGHSHNNFAG